MINAIIAAMAGIFMIPSSLTVKPATVWMNYYGHVYADVATQENRTDRFLFIDHKRDFEIGEEIVLVFDKETENPEDWEIAMVFRK